MVNKLNENALTGVLVFHIRENELYLAYSTAIDNVFSSSFLYEARSKVWSAPPTPNPFFIKISTRSPLYVSTGRWGGGAVIFGELSPDGFVFFQMQISSE